MSQPRCLLLHGFTGAAEDWHDCVGDASEVLAIDLPGHGAADDPSGTFDDEIQRLLQRLPDSIDQVIGYSLGGRLALGLIHAAPQRFRAATILCAHPGLTDPALRAQRRAADQRWIDLLRTQGIDAFVQSWERQPLFASQCRLDPSILDQQRARRLRQRPTGLASCLTSFGLANMPSYWDGLTQFPGQLRWIVGGDDPKFLSLARQVADRRPATNLIVLDKIGHNPILEAPQRLAEWLF